MSSSRKKLEAIRSTEEFRIEALSMATSLSDRQMTSYFKTVVESDKRSRTILDKIFFKQRIMNDIEPSTQIQFLGQELNTPIMIAPLARMATLIPDGNGQMCEATQKTGSMTWIATNPPELYAKYTSANPIVYIEKPWADRDQLLNKLKEAEQAGCIAIGTDVDSSGRRIGIASTSGRAASRAAYRAFGVDELKEFRRQLSKPFVVKGILSVEDAVDAVEAGADIIVVSNHYGVTLDYAQAPLEVLPGIVEAVRGRVDVLVDCQMRTGSDVLKALALGAKGVLIGRPIVWAALVGGAEGMARLIQIMTEELRRAMFYTGVENPTTALKDNLILPKEIFNG